MWGVTCFCLKKMNVLKHIKRLRKPEKGKKNKSKARWKKLHVNNRNKWICKEETKKFKVDFFERGDLKNHKD